MKSYLSVQRSVVASILLLIVILSACSSTRYLNDDQALVKKIKLEGIEDDFKEQAFNYVQRDLRPNSFINLFLYNIVNTKKGKYRTDRIKNIGEAPHVLDSSLVEISRTQIERFLETKSFFKAEVKSGMVVKNKKAYITFTTKQGPSFKIRNLAYDIPDTAVKNVFERYHRLFGRQEPGSRYDADSLNYEREQTYISLRQNGYYDYLRQYMRVRVDTNLMSSQADLEIRIDNPDNKSKHQTYTIDSTYITITNSYERTGRRKDSSVVDSQYLYKDYSRRFNPKAITRYVFFKKGELYNIKNENITYDRLYEVNVFRNIKIDYTKSSDSSNRLNARIEAVPLKKMANRVEAEYAFNSGRNGFNFGDTYTNRNLFGGAEQLEIKFQYGLLFDPRVKGNFSDRIFNRNFQVGANLILPKLLIPFRTDKLIRNGLPHTTISSSIQLFDQKNAFKNRLYVNSLTYNWVETPYKQHSLTPFNIEYREGRLDPVFRDSLRAQGYELYIRTNDRQYFNLGSQYTFTFNAIRLNTYEDFFYFKGSADVGGNTLGMVANLFNFKQDVNGTKTIFGLPYLQYAKAELDLRYYKSFEYEKQFIVRLNTGLAYPYGNTALLPYEKNFYAGGSTGVRAWQARTLGPGNYDRSKIPSEELRKNLRNLDQLGEVRLEANLEYRFKLVNDFYGGKLKGAAFTDFGNVWRVRRFDDTPNGEFRINKFISQLAIGSGAGLRYDLEYFVLRLDAGIKVRDPQFLDSDPWVIKNLFNGRKNDFKDNYKITNSPDTYNFIQYNFGIGMPF